MQEMKTQKQEWSARVEYLFEISPGCSHMLWAVDCFVELCHKFQLTAQDLSGGETDPRLPARAATELVE